MESPLSERARKLISQAKFNHSPSGDYGNRQFADGLIWWQGTQNCEAWGYVGVWSEEERALLEAAGTLLFGRSWVKI